MRNQEVAELLSRIADLLEMKNEGPFRIRAYREAARQIGASPEDVADLHREGRLRAIPGVGESIAAKVAEYLDTGRIQYYDDLRREIAAEAAELLQVPWIGPVRARTIYEQLGVQSLHELERAAEEHMLSTLPGIGERIEEHVRRELGRLRQRLHRLPLGVALPAAEQVMQLLRSQRTVRRVEAAGSLRRMCETVGDVDILVGSEQPDQVIEAVADLPVVKQVLARGPARMSVLTEGNVQVSIRVFPPDHYGSALQHFTGSRAHNLTLRDLALNRGYRLSEYGLFDGRTHRRIAGETEEGVYAALGLPWIPPELREHRGEIEAALEGRLPRLVTLEDIRSDLHLHTNWSDGRDSAEAMIEEAIARGHEYVAITDHSASLGVAHGLSVDRIREQRRFVDALNAKYAPFRVLHGAEVEILPDGALDYPDEVLATLDLVTVSVHSALRQPREQLTRRIIRAIGNPHVHMLNHPTGRRLDHRPPCDIDLEAIVGTAAERGVALEINGNPERLDLNDLDARRVKEHGGLIATNTDAHSSGALAHLRYAVAMARRGWLEPRNVLNTYTLVQIERWLRQEKRAA